MKASDAAAAADKLYAELCDQCDSHERARTGLRNDTEAFKAQVEKYMSAPPPAIRRILVVDDNRDDAALTRRALAALDRVSFATALTGDEALSMARGEAFDLIVIDLNLPGMSGMALAKRLRQFVILLSGVDNIDLAGVAERCGANAALSKQDMDGLLATARKLLDGDAR